MNDIETKRKNIERWTKILTLGGLCLLLGPVFILMIKGMAALIALGITASIAFVAINFIPAFSALVANWRLKALKAVASANPIETLENRYADRCDALAKIRENIKQSYSVLQELYTQIQEHNDKFPDRPSQYLEKYNKLKSLVELRGNKYKQAQANLGDFAQLIEEKRSDWKIAQTMAAASKLANAGEDFQSKLLQDTALNTIQDGLNMAFSELEASLLDEQPTHEDVLVKVTDVTTKTPTTLTEKCGPPTLDLGFDLDAIEAEVVSVKSDTQPKKVVKTVKI